MALHPLYRGSRDNVISGSRSHIHREEPRRSADVCHERRRVANLPLHAEALRNYRPSPAGATRSTVWALPRLVLGHLRQPSPIPRSLTPEVIYPRLSIQSRFSVSHEFTRIDRVSLSKNCTNPRLHFVGKTITQLERSQSLSTVKYYPRRESQLIRLCFTPQFSVSRESLDCSCFLVIAIK